VRDFIRILKLHQEFAEELVEQAIEQALSYGCAHLDGVQYCLHQLISSADPPEQVAAASLDLTNRPDLDAIGNQPIDLSRYEQLLKLSW